MTDTGLYGQPRQHRAINVGKEAASTYQGEAHQDPDKDEQDVGCSSGEGLKEREEGGRKEGAAQHPPRTPQLGQPPARQLRPHVAVEEGAGHQTLRPLVPRQVATLTGNRLVKHVKHCIGGTRETALR